MNPKMTAADAAQFSDQSVQNIHYYIKNKKLEFKKSANRVYFDHFAARELFEINWPTPAQVIAMSVVKGGPGKTSVVKNLGIRLSLYGARVLLVDLDQQGNLTSDFMDNADDKPIMIDIVQGEAEAKESIVNVLPGLDLMPSRLENSALDKVLMVDQHPLDRVFTDIFTPLKSDYNLILVDCPPALSQSVAAAILAADSVIIPVAPEKYCLSGLKMSYTEIRELEKKYKRTIPLSILINKFDGRTNLSREIMEKLAVNATFKDKIMGSVIRLSQEVPNSAARKETIFDLLRPTPAFEDFDLLAREIIAPYRKKKLSDTPTVSLGELDERIAEARV